MWLAAASPHVLRHDRGIAGNVPAQMLGDGARIDVVAAPHRGADHQPQLLAAVEVGHAVGAGGHEAEREQHTSENSGNLRMPAAHAILSGSLRSGQHRAAGAFAKSDCQCL
jgi:hypothetical protein